MGCSSDGPDLRAPAFRTASGPENLRSLRCPTLLQRRPLSKLFRFSYAQAKQAVHAGSATSSFSATHLIPPDRSADARLGPPSPVCPMTPFRNYEFDNPERDAWQKPEEILDVLHLQRTSLVADIGAGTGYFSVRIAKRIPEGKIFAADIEPDMVRYLGERARREAWRVAP